jgi:2-polyprenyl-3-methyl-5-hydroxy-6-metoxy-1,4-benzoquinol methylase
MWLDPRPREEDIPRLYGSYFTHGIERPDPFQGHGMWPQLRRGVMDAVGYRGAAQDEAERLLGRVARFIPPVWDECEELCRSIPGPAAGTLLDVGCGDGTYLQTMRYLGWEVRGLEPDPKAVSVARSRGLEVIQGSVEDLREHDAFDAITMSHVIEHVIDPSRTLQALRDALTPGGTLLVITPNGASLGHRRFGASWYHLDPPRHLHLFNAQNLVACAARTGLEVVRWHTTGRGHLVFDASRSIGKSGRFDLRDPSRRATSGDRLFRVFERTTSLVRKDLGEELYLFCTKQ